MIETIVNMFDIWTDAQGVKSRTRVKGVENISLEGIDKLRELILELAVRGKLVPQNVNDETAAELLKKIEEEKKRLVNEGKIKKQEVFPGIDDDEKPYKIPSNWEWTQLANIYYTISPSDKKLKNSDIIEAGEYPVVDQGKAFIAGYTNSKKLLIEIPGPVVVFGDHTTVKKYIDFDFVAGADGTKILRPYKMNERYFYTYLLSYKLEGKGYSRHFKFLNENYFALPPLAEQHRIAAKVDELMTLCDKLEKEQFNNLKIHQVLVKTLVGTLTQATDTNEFQAAWERISVHFDTLFCTEDSIDQLKQTILQLAIMGKMVSQDPNDQPANELLKQIAKAKEKLIEEGKLKKTAPLAEVSENEKKFLLPKGWEWKRLNDVIDVRDGTHDSPKEAFGQITYPLITSQNFENGSINFDTAKRISEVDYIEISKRSLVERFDILFSMIGGNLGNQVMVDTDIPFSVKNVALFKYYSKAYTSPFFIKKTMEYIALTLQSRAIGGAQPFVSLGFLRNIVIAVPPIAEQNRIVSKIDELFYICDLLKEKVQKSNIYKGLLSKTIVKEVVQ